MAEWASTDYGKKLGDAAAPPLSAQMLRWFQFTQLFRAMMRNRSVIMGVIDSYVVFYYYLMARSLLRLQTRRYPGRIYHVTDRGGFL